MARRPLVVDCESDADVLSVSKETGLSPHSVRVVRNSTLRNSRDSIRLARRRLTRTSLIQEDQFRDPFLPDPSLSERVRKLSKPSYQVQDSIVLAKSKRKKINCPEVSNQSKSEEEDETNFLPDRALVEKVRRSKCVEANDSIVVTKQHRTVRVLNKHEHTPCLSIVSMSRSRAPSRSSRS